MRCKNCDKHVEKDMEICPYCGETLIVKDNTELFQSLKEPMKLDDKYNDEIEYGSFPDSRALVSFICGLSGLVSAVFIIGGLIGIVGAIFGFSSLKSERKAFVIIGIISSLIAISIVLLCLIFKGGIPYYILKE